MQSASFAVSLLLTSIALLTTAPNNAVHGQRQLQLPPDNLVQVMYFTEANVELATEAATFNTCFVSKAGLQPYNYVTFAPYTAAINFYTDAKCEEFAFGLDGHYSDHPGAKSGSFQWVGLSKENFGELVQDAPFKLDASLVVSPPISPPNTVSPVTPPPPPLPVKPPPEHDNGNEAIESGSARTSSVFFGGLAGTAMLVSIGGLVYWKTRDKKSGLDKGKNVLPYNRVDDHHHHHDGKERGDQDEEILLAPRHRIDDGSFELEGDDDDDDDDEDDTLDEKHHRQNYNKQYNPRVADIGEGSSAGGSGSSSSRSSGTYGRHKERYDSS
ncbi:hypothetical protein BG004_008404 [Podila humilis]|nr:hypothetical protein BG004_008404 [Podila humilis]